MPDDHRDKDVLPVVGIGASAGGLEAFSQFLSHVPVTTGSYLT
jgi:two-component system CheB/CheR fusion protein